MGSAIEGGDIGARALRPEKRPDRPGFAAIVCAWICTAPFVLATIDFGAALLGMVLDDAFIRHATCVTAFMLAVWASASRRVVRIAGYIGVVCAPLTLFALLLLPLTLVARPALWYWVPILVVFAAMGCLQLGFRTHSKR